AALVENIIAPRNCLYFSDFLAITSNLRFETSKDDLLGIDWKERFQQYPEKADYTPRQSRSDQPVGDLNQFVFFAKRWRSLKPTKDLDAVTLFRLLWLVWRLITDRQPLTVEAFVDEQNEFDRFFRTEQRSTADGGKQEDSPFATFLGRAMRWLLSESMSYDVLRRLLRMAVLVAREGATVSSKAGEVATLHQCLTETEVRRTWALLAWAAAPALRKLLEVGFRREETFILGHIAEQFLKVADWLRTEDAAR